MANPEHVKIVKEGAEAIAKWRHDHPKEILNLSEANLRGASLSWADLLGASLWGANLSGANLLGASLWGASLWGANLLGASLRGASLWGASLWGASLWGANLSEANLSGASLWRANLSEANLSGADLFGANFSEASLSGANLTKAICWSTVFGACDLSSVKGLETVQHQAPSSIGIDTIITSFRGAGNKLTPDLKTFFLKAGVPDELLDELPRIISEIEYYSCFIAYGEPDKTYAEKLVEDLRSRGVSCWLYPTDRTPGERTWQEIKKRRQEAEKFLVVCSVLGLMRDGLLKEIEEQIDEDPAKILPICRDLVWREDGFPVIRGKRNLKPSLLELNYVDFSDLTKYEKSLEELLGGLKRKKTERSRVKRT